MTTESKTYGLTDSVSDEIPTNCDRISLVTDDRTGTAYYQVEKPDGSFYLCDADGDVANHLSSWTLHRVLADVPTDDSDEFFAAIAATAKGMLTTVFEAGEGEGYWKIEEDHYSRLYATSNAETCRLIEPAQYRGWDADEFRASLANDGVEDELIERILTQAGLI